VKKAIFVVIVVIVLLGIIVPSDRSEETKEVSNQLVATDISKFDYSIDNGKLVLQKYKGREKAIVISENYSIEGIEYEVTEIAHAIFNGCSADTIYLPKTLIKVYDDTLAYLNAEHINLYFGGSEENWNNIFTKYEIADTKERWNDGDAEGAGEALADKLNSKFGHEYDESKFTYHFETNISDIELN